jgi:hypothetical protein
VAKILSLSLSPKMSNEQLLCYARGACGKSDGRGFGAAASSARQGGGEKTMRESLAARRVKIPQSK